MLIAKFLDEIWLMDEQKNQLRAKFELWWLTVADYDRLQFALVCTKACNHFADTLFSKGLLSKTAFYRCAIIASGLLLASLSISGISNNQLLGVMPWENFRQSCAAVDAYADTIVNSGMTGRPVTQNTTTDITGTNVEDLHGQFYVGYYFAKRSDTDSKLPPQELWSNIVASIRQSVARHNTTNNVVFYSIGYYLLLVAANIVLSFCSLVCCRVVLREICATGRPLTTVALLFTNAASVLVIASVVLLLLIMMALPLSWLLIPLARTIARKSLIIFGAMLLCASFGSWGLDCFPLKLIVIIAFLPSMFSICAALFSLATILCRNIIHAVVSALLLRCAERSPLFVIGGIFGLITVMITTIAKLIHGTLIF
jgi:hypothetical protein